MRLTSKKNNHQWLILLFIITFISVSHSEDEETKTARPMKKKKLKSYIDFDDPNALYMTRRFNNDAFAIDYQKKPPDQRTSASNLNGQNHYRPTRNAYEIFVNHPEQSQQRKSPNFSPQSPRVLEVYEGNTYANRNVEFVVPGQQSVRYGNLGPNYAQYNNVPGAYSSSNIFQTFNNQQTNPGKSNFIPNQGPPINYQPQQLQGPSYYSNQRNDAYPMTPVLIYNFQKPPQYMQQREPPTNHRRINTNDENAGLSEMELEKLKRLQKDSEDMNKLLFEIDDDEEEEGEGEVPPIITKSPGHKVTKAPKKSSKGTKDYSNLKLSKEEKDFLKEVPDFKDAFDNDFFLQRAIKTTKPPDLSSVKNETGYVAIPTQDLIPEDDDDSIKPFLLDHKKMEELLNTNPVLLGEDEQPPLDFLNFATTTPPKHSTIPPQPAIHHKVNVARDTSTQDYLEVENSESHVEIQENYDPDSTSSHKFDNPDHTEETLHSDYHEGGNEPYDPDTNTHSSHRESDSAPSFDQNLPPIINPINRENETRPRVFQDEIQTPPIVAPPNYSNNVPFYLHPNYAPQFREPMRDVNFRYPTQQENFIQSPQQNLYVMPQDGYLPRYGENRPSIINQPIQAFLSFNHQPRPIFNQELHQISNQGGVNPVNYYGADPTRYRPEGNFGPYIEPPRPNFGQNGRINSEGSHYVDNFRHEPPIEQRPAGNFGPYIEPPRFNFLPNGRINSEGHQLPINFRNEHETVQKPTGNFGPHIEPPRPNFGQNGRINSEGHRAENYYRSQPPTTQQPAGNFGPFIEPPRSKFLQNGRINSEGHQFPANFRNENLREQKLVGNFGPYIEPPRPNFGQNGRINSEGSPHVINFSRTSSPFIHGIQTTSIPQYKIAPNHFSNEHSSFVRNTRITPAPSLEVNLIHGGENNFNSHQSSAQQPTVHFEPPRPTYAPIMSKSALPRYYDDEQPPPNDQNLMQTKSMQSATTPTPGSHNKNIPFFGEDEQPPPDFLLPDKSALHPQQTQENAASHFQVQENVPPQQEDFNTQQDFAEPDAPEISLQPLQRSSIDDRPPLMFPQEGHFKLILDPNAKPEDVGIEYEQLRGPFLLNKPPPISYSNLVLNPFEQKLPEMGFVFQPTIVRVQHPNFILHELYHYKLLLDKSPIMDALFSPETVPIPPSAPWPSNFQAQKYLPPQEVLQDETEEDSLTHQNLRRTNQPQNMRKNLAPQGSLRRVEMQSNSPQQDLRRIAKPNMPEENLRRVMNQNPPEHDLRRVMQPNEPQTDLRRVMNPNGPDMRRVMPNGPDKNLRRVIQPDMKGGNEGEANQTDLRRAMNGVIEDSIRRSMESMNALFKPKSNMPVIPELDLTKAISEAVKSKIEDSKSSSSSGLVQIGNGNKNFGDGKMLIQIEEEPKAPKLMRKSNRPIESEPSMFSDDEFNMDDETTQWPGNMEAMNQVLETTTEDLSTTTEKLQETTTDVITTELPNTTKNPLMKKHSKDENETTTENFIATTTIKDFTTIQPILTTNDFQSTTISPDETTTDPSTGETTTFETTTYEIGNRIDAKVISTLLG